MSTQWLNYGEIRENAYELNKRGQEVLP